MATSNHSLPSGGNVFTTIPDIFFIPEFVSNDRIPLCSGLWASVQFHPREYKVYLGWKMYHFRYGCGSEMVLISECNIVKFRPLHIVFSWDEKDNFDWGTEGYNLRDHSKFDHSVSHSKLSFSTTTKIMKEKGAVVSMFFQSCILNQHKQRLCVKGNCFLKWVRV